MWCIYEGICGQSCSANDATTTCPGKNNFFNPLFTEIEYKKGITNSSLSSDYLTGGSPISFSMPFFKNIENGYKVIFGSIVQPANFTSSTTIESVTPAVSSSGSVDVTITLNGQPYSVGTFLFTYYGKRHVFFFIQSLQPKIF